MGEPEHTAMHNYAYHPSVANWVQSTSLATQLDGASDEATETPPDDFYRFPPGPAAHIQVATTPDVDDMATTRQRQASNGAVGANGPLKSSSRPSPSSSHLAARTTPQLPGNRPTVRSLAQKFNQPSSTESSPSSTTRARPVRPNQSQRSVSDTRGGSTASRTPTKEPAYGPHTFKNLKPRERPQPAPASPVNSRRGNGGGATLSGEKSALARRKPVAAPRKQSQSSNSGRQPFFGEVVGEHNVATPGFGIPTLDAVPPEAESTATIAPGEGDPSIVTTNPDSRPSNAPLNAADSPRQHRRAPSSNRQTPSGQHQAAQVELTEPRDSRRRSPPSRIPVASRRMSAASDSSSSTRSYKASTARPPGGYNRTSPVRTHKPPFPRENPSKSKTKLPGSTLPSSSYRDYRERGKSPKGAANGASLAAVITTTPQPPSPRLRNSRERQLHPHGSPESSPRAPDSQDDSMLGARGEMIAESATTVRSSLGPDQAPSMQDPAVQSDRAPIMNASDEAIDTVDAQPDHTKHQSSTSHAGSQPNSLSLQTDGLGSAQSDVALSPTAKLSYEESPVLGMPGSFMATPPIPQGAQNTATEEVEKPEPPASQAPASNDGELLQPLTFQPFTRPQALDTAVKDNAPQARDTIVTDSAASEFGIRESIPIMLGSDTMGERLDDSPRLDMSARKWRAEPLDASGTISYLEEEDSPIDPFADRGTLHPEDSASVAFYNGREGQSQRWPVQLPTIPDAGGLTLDSEAYSVINRVLNLYAKSPEITPEVAHESRRQVQQVSPIIAQHKDWYSKDATETYLARLLSDANASTPQLGNDDVAAEASSRQNEKSHKDAPALDITDRDDDAYEHQAGGTAIIYPPESRRYSRGSRGSHGSTATTIWDDASRAGSISAAQARDPSPAGLSNGQQRLQPATFNSVPQSTSQNSSQGAQRAPRESYERQESSYSGLLPQIEGTGEGLGLSLEANRQHHQRQQHEQPPRLVGQPRSRSPAPAHHYAAAPQPLAGRAPYTPSVYVQGPPSGAPYASSGPPPQSRTNANMCLTPGAPFSYGQGPSADTERETLYSAHQSSSETLPVGQGAWAVQSSAERIPNGVYAAQNEAPKYAEAEVEEVNRFTPEGHHRAAFPNEDEEAYTRRLHRRFRILEELVTTENTYLSDLMVISQIWVATSKDAFPSPAERATVFSNIEDIADFDNQLVVDLKQAFEPVAYWKKTGDEPETDEEEEEDFSEPENPFIHVNLHNDDQTSVGYVLRTYLSTIESLYTKYLLNHERASKVISQHKKHGDDVFLGWQTACAQGCKDITDAWDLDSLLVKPVQRLLKYPLLLQTLKDVTPPTHDDYDDIEAARQGIIDISNRINDLKKRQETLRMATREGRKERKKGFRGIDIVKALTSKEKTKSSSSEFVDNEYDQWAQKFGGNFFQIQIIIKDMENYRDEITTCFVHLNIVALHMVSLLEEQPSSKPEVESTWRRNAMALLELRNVLLEEHKAHVTDRILTPLRKLWAEYVRPQKLMEQRKKGLVQYIKYKQALERKEKIDPKFEDQAQQFLTVNDALKEELPKLYDCTKRAVRAILHLFIMYQKEWWKSCQKKILPLLEHEPEHTTSFTHDMRDYINRFHSDWNGVQAIVDRLAICNGNLLHDIGNFQSPHVSLYTDDSSSRKSTSRRTESMGSEISTLVDPRHRRSGGYPSRRSGPSFEDPPRSAPNGPQPVQQSAGDYAWELPYVGMSSHAPRGANRLSPPTGPRDERAISPASDRSDMTVVKSGSERSSLLPFPSLDDAFAVDNHSSGSGGSSYMMVNHNNHTSSAGSSSRASAIFNSALPMESANRSAEELPGTPADPEEPEVLFLAASLFEFNIAHDRREGGIPYLVYVPGEIFDVIGMKGELWLARNQDDPSRTVGWIWEKHFARILPEET